MRPTGAEAKIQGVGGADPVRLSSSSGSGRLQARSGTLVLAGYGVRVAIERGQLAVSDGIGRERRAGTLSRATCGLKRLVMLGHSGTISFEALRWLSDLGAAFVQIDADANVLVASAPAGLDDARLRRAQALALSNGVGLAIARDLLNTKLEKQAGVIERMGGHDEAVSIIRTACDGLGQAETVEALTRLEAAAANAYWEVWSSIPIRFARKDEPRVPSHWRTFGGRGSPISGSQRKAANPANALLNYLYAMLEAEARIAALAVGLDPGMGVLHADLPRRDSLACDLMEAVRPDVDAYVLELLRTRTCGAKDFFETREGVCRVLPPLTHVLAETGPRWVKAIGPVAEMVARTLNQVREPAVTVPSMVQGTPQVSNTDKRSLPTPLTQANRSAGRERQRRKPTAARSGGTIDVPQRCIACGAVLDDDKRQYCDRCLPERRAELAPSFSATGPQALATRRAMATDPAHGGTTAEKRGQRVAEQWRELAAWEDSHETDADIATFEQDIQPRLAGMSLAAMMEATGLSRRYCWLIKTRQKVPHPRHWNALNQTSTSAEGFGRSLT
jgi:CRISPR-associated endonuclease Cas1